MNVELITLVTIDLVLRLCYTTVLQEPKVKMFTFIEGCSLENINVFESVNRNIKTIFLSGQYGAVITDACAAVVFQ